MKLLRRLASKVVALDPDHHPDAWPDERRERYRAELTAFQEKVARGGYTYAGAGPAVLPECNLILSDIDGCFPTSVPYRRSKQPRLPHSKPLSHDR